MLTPVEGHVAAVAEAINPDLIGIDEGQPFEVAPGLDDVLQIIDTHLVVEGVRARQDGHNLPSRL